MKKIMILALIHVFFLQGCVSQTNQDDVYKVEGYTILSSTGKNEFDLTCEYYVRSKNDSIKLQVCYWDSSRKRISSRHFKVNGTYNGPCVYWSTDGKIVMTGNYLNNKKHNFWKYYLFDKVVTEGTYRDGNRVGVWKEYDSKGNLIKETNYDKETEIGSGAKSSRT